MEQNITWEQLRFLAWLVFELLGNFLTISGLILTIIGIFLSIYFYIHKK